MLNTHENQSSMPSMHREKPDAPFIPATRTHPTGKKTSVLALSLIFVNLRGKKGAQVMWSPPKTAQTLNKGLHQSISGLQFRRHAPQGPRSPASLSQVTQTGTHMTDSTLRSLMEWCFMVQKPQWVKTSQPWQEVWPCPNGLACAPHKHEFTVVKYTCVIYECPQ